jgi:hypothetical protein
MLWKSAIDREIHCVGAGSVREVLAGLGAVFVRGFFVNYFELSKTEQRREVSGPRFTLSPFFIGIYPATESSVTLPSLVKASIMFTYRQVLCTRCRKTVILARIAPGPAGFGIRTFQCSTCDHLQQRVVEIDPMKSKIHARWLQGELQAPK